MRREKKFHNSELQMKNNRRETLDRRASVLRHVRSY